MPKLHSQLSIEQRSYLFRKSLRKARLKYGRELMIEADAAAMTLLTDEQLCQMGHMPDFGEAVAAWYKTLLFFEGRLPANYGQNCGDGNSSTVSE